jgi:hypothetical protein
MVVSICGSTGGAGSSTRMARRCNSAAMKFPSAGRPIALPQPLKRGAVRGQMGRAWVGLGQKPQPPPDAVLRNAGEGNSGASCNPRRFKAKRTDWAAALVMRGRSGLFGTPVAVSTGNKLCLTLKPCGRLPGRPCGLFCSPVFGLRFGPTRVRQHTARSPACQNPRSMRRVAWSTRFELSQRR